VKAQIELYPALIPLARTLREILHHAGLSCPYEGGLGGYNQIVLIATYFHFLDEMSKRSRAPSPRATSHSRRSTQRNGMLGAHLIGFMHMFGVSFDPRSHCIEYQRGECTYLFFSFIVESMYEYDEYNIIFPIIIFIFFSLYD
jgi:DNA polymerase sigma